MKSFVVAALGAGAFTFASAPAVAAPDAAAGLQAMRELNLIVLGDLSANGQEVEGKTFVGGNVTGAGTNWSIGNGSQGAVASDWRSLTVNGNNLNTGQVNNGSNGGNGNAATTPGLLVGGNSVGMNLNAANSLFDIGGDLSGNMNLSSGMVINVGGNASGMNGSGGVTVKAGGTISGNQNGAVFSQNNGIGWNAASTSTVTGDMLTTLTADLQALSTHLAGLTIASNPSSITMGGQGPIFNAVGGANGFALLDFSPAQFGSEINFNLSDPGLTVIVNVAGTDIDWNMNAMGGYNASVNQNIIWNFYEAQTIDFNRIVHGSVLAPYATISNVTPIEGSVVALAMKMGGEVHLGTYNGDGVPFRDPPADAVPEPATWAMLILGFGLVGSAVRRRERLARVQA